MVSFVWDSLQIYFSVISLFGYTFSLVVASLTVEEEATILLVANPAIIIEAAEVEGSLVEVVVVVVAEIVEVIILRKVGYLQTKKSHQLTAFATSMLEEEIAKMVPIVGKFDSGIPQQWLI